MVRKNKTSKRAPVGDLGIIAMPGCETFVNNILSHIGRWRKCADINSYLIDASFPRFASGEAKGLVSECVRGKDIYIITDIFNYSVTYKMYDMDVPMSPDDHFQDLKRAISALGGKALRITVIMPMLYEGRQHKRSGRESLDCAIALQELEKIGVHNIITVDAHDTRVQNSIPFTGFDNLRPSYQMMKALLAHEPDIKIDDEHLCIISPDEGGVARCLFYSSILNVNVGMFYKRRDYSVIVNGTNPIVAHEYLGPDVKGKDIIVVDDMISSGGSMIDVFTKLKEFGARRIFAFSSFGLFCNGLEVMDKAFDEGLFDKIFTTNLIYRTDELLSRKWYGEVEMSKYMAFIIEELNHDESISNLMDASEKIKQLCKN